MTSGCLLHSPGDVCFDSSTQKAHWTLIARILTLTTGVLDLDHVAGCRSMSLWAVIPGLSGDSVRFGLWTADKDLSSLFERV